MGVPVVAISGPIREVPAPEGVDIEEGVTFSSDFELIVMAIAFAVCLYLTHRKKRPSRGKGAEVAPGTRRAMVAQPDAPERPKAPRPITLERLVQYTIELRIPTQKALESYAALRESGAHHNIASGLGAKGSKYTALDFYVALVQCAGRGGFPEQVGQLLDDMADLGIERPLSIYESAMRLLASKKHFKEAIDVYERLERDGLEPSSNTLSCLVGFAFELGDYDRAVSIFERLVAIDFVPGGRGVAPNVRAVLTILRVYSKSQDWCASKTLLHHCWKADSLKNDAPLLNIALGTGIAARCVDEAEAMLLTEPAASMADVNCYNTVLRGLQIERRADRTAALFEVMSHRGVKPNNVTFNTCMDAAARSGCHAEAWQMYSIMNARGLTPDKYTCSTLAKMLQNRVTATAPRVEGLLDMLDSSSPSCSTQDGLSAECRRSLLGATFAAAVRLARCKLATRAFLMLRPLCGVPPEAELQAFAKLRSRLCGPTEESAIEGLDASDLLAMLDREVSL